MELQRNTTTEIQRPMRLTVIGREDHDEVVPHTLRLEELGDIAHSSIGIVHHCVVELPVVLVFIVASLRDEIELEMRWE
jgi:hypothetical protein